MTQVNDRAELLAAFRGRWGPLDYLSLGDKERIHSEALRWLFLKGSPHEARRDQLLAELVGVPPGRFTVFDARSELAAQRRRLDIWLTLDAEGRSGIAIENKLLAFESRGQTHDTQREPRTKRSVEMFVFLSLRRCEGDLRVLEADRLCPIAQDGGVSP